MRCLERNKQTFWYALYTGREEIQDEYGNATGQYKLTYDNPVSFRASVSAARGESETLQFGENVTYDKTIVLDETSPTLDEFTILWIDTTPELDDSGATTTPHDYIVKKVAKGLNHITLAISKVTVGNG